EQGGSYCTSPDIARRECLGRNGCHDRAVLLYEYVGKRIVDLQHTEVPDAYRGRGIAKHLAKVGGAEGEGHGTCWRPRPGLP
uniref:Protein NATD1 n=1 Tax=Panthera tigris altaica TaxID=74533 RepID=A0A8C9MC50_PANTA